MSADRDIERAAGRPRFFFQHIMKTAGTSFVQHLLLNFTPDEIYPIPSDTWEDRQEQYWLIRRVRDITAEQRAHLRLYHGHLPFLVGDLVDADVRLSILRDPVERVISHVRHCRRHFAHHAGKPLEEIYEDAWLHPLFFRNYQVKQFALTEADHPKAHNEDVIIDDAKLRVALANLPRLDVLGLTERYEEFTDEVVARFGWSLGDDIRLQGSPGPLKVSKRFVARIEADNRAELEFYEAARKLYAERSSR